MNTIYEEKELTQDKVAIEHNAQIKERYNRLKSAEEAQLNETFEREMNQSATIVQDAPVVVPTIGHEIVDSPLFRTDTLDKIIENERGGKTQTTVQSVSVAESTEAVSYSLTNFAKAVIMAVATVVMLMFTAICINSHVISVNQTTIDALQERYETLVSENAEYAKLIEQARSEERIAEWANLNGWTLN